MEKIKRKCNQCGTETMLNKYHGVDVESIESALMCNKCRNLKKASDINKKMSQTIFGK